MLLNIFLFLLSVYLLKKLVQLFHKEEKNYFAKMALNYESRGPMLNMPGHNALLDRGVYQPSNSPRRVVEDEEPVTALDLRISKVSESISRYQSVNPLAEESSNRNHR